MGRVFGMMFMTAAFSFTYAVMVNMIAVTRMTVVNIVTIMVAVTRMAVVNIVTIMIALTLPERIMPPGIIMYCRFWQ